MKLYQKKEKNKKLHNKKIKNYINELHWKTINYLTKNYEIIFIGNMSSKKIISNENHLNKMTKRITQAYSFYKFKERLKYKCFTTNTKYKLVDESYTSKICSNCGSVNEELGNKKIFNCSICKIVMDRDTNGSRNILLKGL